MKWSTVEDRINFLVNLLQLEGITDSMILNMRYQKRSYYEEISYSYSNPKLKRSQYYVSGGQARRVSLAVAVLHKPQLIILDEPTVITLKPFQPMLNLITK